MLCKLGRFPLHISTFSAVLGKDSYLSNPCPYSTSFASPLLPSFTIQTYFFCFDFGSQSLFWVRFFFEKLVSIGKKIVINICGGYKNYSQVTQNTGNTYVKKKKKRDLLNKLWYNSYLLNTLYGYFLPRWLCSLPCF